MPTAAIVEGVPAGQISESQINTDLHRQSGYGRGGQRIERDTVEVNLGVRFGRTLGTPSAPRGAQPGLENWTDRMAAFIGDRLLSTRPRSRRAPWPRRPRGGAQTDTSDRCRNILERKRPQDSCARGGRHRASSTTWAWRFRTSISEARQEDDALMNAPPAPLAIETSEVRCPMTSGARRP